mmetsp:Transcript_32146/g.68442  ORF Transcript_32146/g.68442 Transcript_32146/m.68442 type:complete len:239 (-) Transcript_32146:1073-1789(-)
MTDPVAFLTDSFDGMGGNCGSCGLVGAFAGECFSLSCILIRYLDLTRRATARSSSTFRGPGPSTSSPTRLSVRSMISEKSKTVTLPSRDPGMPEETSPGFSAPCSPSFFPIMPSSLFILRSRPISTHTSHSRSRLTSCNTSIALGSMNIFQKGLALSSASILSTALENRRNLASMSVMLMQVMPKGRTEASSVIISSREMTSFSALPSLSSGNVDSFASVALSLGTNREWTAGQLSTM